MKQFYDVRLNDEGREIARRYTKGISYNDILRIVECRAYADDIADVRRMLVDREYQITPLKIIYCQGLIHINILILRIAHHS